MSGSNTSRESDSYMSESNTSRESDSYMSESDTSQESDSSRLSPPHLPEDNVKYLYGFCPPPLSADVDWGTLPDKCLTFYDRHTDEKLILRRVVPHYGLISSLATIAQAELKDLLDSGIPLPDDAYSKGHRLESARDYKYLKGKSLEVAGSSGVARFYGKTIAAVCLPISSLMLIRPVSWSCVLMWTDRESGKHSNEYDNPFMQNGFSLSVKHAKRKLRVGPTAFSRLDAKTKEMLDNMAKFSPVLVTWQIYSPSPETDDVIRKMGRGPLSGLSVSATVGALPVPSRCTPPPDALTSPVRLPRHEHLFPAFSPLPARRSARLRKEDKTTPPTSRTIKSLPSRKRFPRIYPPLSSIGQGSAIPNNELHAEELLQHGWNEAVREDSTFIVYTNGNLERIGLRHRKTQTLYLSDVVKVPKCDPAYVQVHVGLYIAAFRDSVDRSTQIRENQRMPGQSTEDTSQPPASKRRKIDVAEQEERSQPADENHMKRIFVEASSRNLLLLRISDGVHNSIVPASFLRCGSALFPAVLPAQAIKAKVSYTASDYMTIIIGQYISSGATGAVHDAVLELRTKDGHMLTYRVVVKLAFFPEQRERMRNEFVAYQQLAASRVKGVPAVLGLFDDVEGSANALVMNYCGTSLSKSRLLEDDHNVRVSEAEKAAFLDIIENIHEAGVRHRDVRPANLVLDEDGTATIIDFDRAELNPTPAERKREYGRLKSLLEGHFTDGGSW